VTTGGPPRRIFGSKPGGYGAGLLPRWTRGTGADADLAEMCAVWGSYAWAGLDGRAAQADMESAHRGRGQEHRHPQARHRRLRRLLPVHGGMVAMGGT
jgi:cobaltochelatase CobN